MSQPKHRRRKARRRAQAARANAGKVYIHVSTTGNVRNPIGSLARRNMIVYTGFGSALVLCDGQTYCGGDRPNRRSMREKRGQRRGFVTVRTIERHIRRMRLGGRQWAISIRAALWDARWERQRAGKWVCVDAGMGFA